VQIDSADLAAFRAGMRRRYSDEEILSQLKASAERLGRSPTMREFEGDRHAHVHPQTVIERFGTWNTAKRLAGLRARRFATREELLDELRSLGAELGRPPTGGDLQRRRATMPSKSLYWHTFGSLRSALREAGFDVPLGEERLERAVEDGVRLSRRLRRLPRFADWAAARRRDPRLPSEWQVYRLAGGRRGAWATFQYLVRNRLVEEGSSVSQDGRVSARRRPSRARRGARGRTGAAPGRARRGAALP
jgi:Homing endonuclease associated repeat